MKIIASITDGDAIQRLLDHLGEPIQAPRIAQAACGPPFEEAFDTREGTDAALNEPYPTLSSISGRARRHLPHRTLLLVNAS
jgi:hypothetical protein